LTSKLVLGLLLIINVLVLANPRENTVA